MFFLRYQSILEKELLFCGHVGQQTLFDSAMIRLFGTIIATLPLYGFYRLAESAYSHAVTCNACKGCLHVAELYDARQLFY